MPKLDCIPRIQVDITSTEAPEIAHLKPLDAESMKGQKGKSCWERLIAKLKKILCAQRTEDELHPIPLRTEKTMEQVREMIEEKSKTNPGDYAKDISKFQALNYPILTINDMINQIKEIVLELTFSRHFSLKDALFADLAKGKTMIGLYVWMCSYCFYQAGSGDKGFWSRFSHVASQSILMWSDVLTIIATVENLRDTGTHIVRMMDKHVLDVPLEKEGRKFRNQKDEMNKMKNFDHLKADMAWGSDLSQPRPLRVLFTKCDPLTSQSPWLSFEMLDTKIQYKYLNEILSYADLLFVPITPLLTKLKATSIQIEKTIRLDPYTDTDVIMGMIILDKLDLLSLAVKTLKLYIKEIRSTVHVCYEFCRYTNQRKDTKTFEDLEKHTVIDLKSVNVVLDPPITIHETTLKYNTQTYPDILQHIPLYTAEFNMILQDLKDVFDFDALSSTNEDDM